MSQPLRYVPRLPIKPPSPEKLARLLDVVHDSDDAADDLRCADDPRPRLEPRTAELMCFAATREFYPHFKAHKARLDFYLPAEEAVVSAFFHLGRGDQPQIKRGSKYYAAWVIANGGEKPARDDRMPLKTFVGKCLTVEIRDARAHSNGDVYSVAEIVIPKRSAAALSGRVNQTRKLPKRGEVTSFPAKA